MVDPKRVLALLSKQRAAKRKAALEAAKDIFFKMRAAQLRQAALNTRIVADSPFGLRDL
jgi:hypothetical protein